MPLPAPGDTGPPEARHGLHTVPLTWEITKVSWSDGDVTDVFCGPKGPAELAQDKKGAQGQREQPSPAACQSLRGSRRWAQRDLRGDRWQGGREAGPGRKQKVVQQRKQSIKPNDN